MRFIFRFCFLVYLYVGAVFAQPDCSVYLSNSDVHVSSHGQAYLKLIDYFIQNNSNDQDGSLVVRRVLQSADPINAFADDASDSLNSNSLMYRLKMAADRLLPELTKEDWSPIQSSLRKRVYRWRGESQDRREKSLTTRSVFFPQLLESDFQLPRGSGIASSPTWQKVGDRELLAVSILGGGIAIYQKVGKKISLVVEAVDRIDPTSNIIWHSEGDRIFLSVGDNHEFFWIELVGNKLVYQKAIPVKGRVLHPPACRTVNTDTYCVISTNVGNIHLFRLVDGRLEPSDQRLKDSNGFQYDGAVLFPLHWLELNGQHYLMSRVQWSSEAYQIVDGKLVDVEFSELRKAPPFSDLLRIDINGRIFFIYSHERKIRLLEFRDSDFYLVDEFQWTNARAYTKWSLLRRGDRFYVAGTNQRDPVGIFEFANERIKKIGSLMNTSMTSKGEVMAWVPIEGRNILAIGDGKGTMKYFELVGKSTRELYSFEFKSAVSSVDTWFRDGGELFQIVGTNNPHIHLVRVLGVGRGSQLDQR